MGNPRWTRHRFAEMVDSIGATRKARGWSASDSGVDRYVGLEHLDSNSLRIRRWGSPEDVGTNSDIRHFELGDVILARRGIELRKVGLATFKGVASGHALVFRANPRVIHPGFLPYFIQSNAFMLRADQHSVGSLSRTVNLSSLLNECFLLPPLSVQERMAVLFSAQRAATEQAFDAGLRLATLRKSVLADAFRPERGARDKFPSHWEVVSISKAGECQLGQQRHPMFDSGDNIRPYLRVANVLDGEFDLSDVLSMHFPKGSLSKFELQPGDILLNEGQSPDLVGRSAIWRGAISGACIQKTLIRFRCKAGLLPEFAHAFFQHMLYTGQFSAVCVQTTSIAHLTADRFKKLQIPIPPRPEQEWLVDRLLQLDEARRSLSDRFCASQSMARLAVNELLGT